MSLRVACKSPVCWIAGGEAAGQKEKKIIKKSSQPMHP